MNRLRDLSFISLTCMMLASSSWSADGVALMKIDHSAQFAGMAGAAVSLSGDPDLVVYNPSSQVGNTKFAAVFGHTKYWENIRLESAFFSLPLSAKIIGHGGFRFAGVKDLEARDDVPSVTPDYFFDLHDISAKGGIAYQVNDKTSLGISFGWFLEKISIYRGSAFNVDLGGQYQARPNIRLGAAVNNLGSTFKLSAPGAGSSDDIKLPTTVRVGGSYTYDKYLGSVDIVMQDGDAHAHGGAEYRIAENFRLRAGYAAGYDTRGFTAGLTGLYRNFGFSYAFVPFSDQLGTTHMFSLRASL